MRYTILCVVVSLLLLVSVLSLSACNHSPEISEDNQNEIMEQSLEAPEEANDSEGNAPAASSNTSDEKSYYERLMEKIAAEQDPESETTEPAMDKDEAIARYAELEKQLAGFDASHDLEHMEEEGHEQRLAITEEMEQIYRKYLAKPYSPSDEEVLIDIINMSDWDLIEIESCRKKLQNESYCEKNPDRVPELRDVMESLIVKHNYIHLMEMRYKDGWSPSILLKEFDQFREKHGLGDWKDFLQKEPYWNDIWNSGELIE